MTLMKPIQQNSTNNMETLENEKLITRIHESWQKDLEGLEEYFESVIGGKVIGAIHTEPSGEMNHSVVFVIIKNPEYRLSNNQLCMIADEGNHCISTGSIVYEEDFAYIVWSSMGHI